MMTPKERAAMQQALEAIESMVGLDPLGWNYEKAQEAITALREALGYCVDEGCPHRGTTHTCVNPLAEQAEQDLETCPGCGGVADNGHDREFPPNPYYCTKCSEQAEQEPVNLDALVLNKKELLIFDYEYVDGWNAALEEAEQHLNAAPIRTKDLTDDEIWAEGSFLGLSENAIFAFARAVIAAYKEKNK